MDIPLPDELEWLEAHSRLHQEDLLNAEPSGPYPYPPEDDDIPEEEEEDQQQSLHRQASSHPKSPRSLEERFNVHKRPLRDETSAPLNHKRSRTRTGDDDDDDDDWLRYSPPLQIDNVERRGEEEVEVVLEPEEVVISRYAYQIDGECIPVTAPGGDRVYAKFCRWEIDDSPTKKVDIKPRSGGLIIEPVNLLLQRCEKEAFMKVLGASSEVVKDQALPDKPNIHEELWVDKYSPNSFSELLSDEQTNREVLLWLKQWDTCVFGSEIRSTTDDVLSALRRHSSFSYHRSHHTVDQQKISGGQRWTKESYRNAPKSDRLGGNFNGTLETCSKNSRLTGPPEQKVLLLCGPPGLGKTTLAHVAAKHCGYRVVEINASDDRSSAMVESKIRDVVQMNSVMADSKPKCLVIDEIDGALGDGKGAVEVILKMVSAEKKIDGAKQSVPKEEQSGRISKRRQKTLQLLRPVICICNDLYAPALRPLRQIAKVHIFVQPSVSRVVSRLKHICNKEGMKTSSIALAALAEYTACDIRSCLNTLQFLNKKKESLNVLDISSQVIGQKDISRNIFDIWKEIFHKEKIKTERKSCSPHSFSGKFDVLYSLISSRSDYDLVLEGVHENILQLYYHDPMMQQTVACFDKLSMSDLIHQNVMRSQHMQLQVYQPYVAIAIHRIIAQVQNPSIEWPKSYQRCRTMLMERIETLRDWHHRTPPHISRHLSVKSFIEDSVSPLLHILSPPNLKPVAVHLLSETEKNVLVQLVNTMVSYSMTYKNTDSSSQSSNLKQDGTSVTSTLNLDPPIHDYVNFKGYASSHHILPGAMKQVLVYEVEKQKILHGGTERSAYPADRYNEVEKDAQGEKTSEASSTHPAVTTGAVNDIESGASSFTSQFNINRTTSSEPLAHGRASKADMKLKSAKDSNKPFAGFNFFDRFRKSNGENSQSMTNAVQKPATSKKDSNILLFKFNEGYTNAIKRPVRIREFFL